MKPLENSSIINQLSRINNLDILKDSMNLKKLI